MTNVIDPSESLPGDPPSGDQRHPLETCHALIEDAKRGAPRAREELASRYLAVVRAFLRKRWRHGPLADHVDDAVQEVFVDLFKDNGALLRHDPSKARDFSAYLFGVTKNIALRHEAKAMREGDLRFDPGSVGFDAWPSDDTALSRVFDREWAIAVMRRARLRLEDRASHAGAAALQRVEILRLRFQDGLPIRDIARVLDLETAHAHHEYARARAEFKRALRDEVASDGIGDTEAIEQRCRDLLDLLATGLQMRRPS